MDENTLDFIKEKERKRQALIADLISGGIALALGALIFLLYFFLNEEGRTLKTACNGAALSGGILLCGGLLIWLARLGVFDIFAFGFIQLGTILFSRDVLKNQTFVEYKQKRVEKVKNKSKYYFVIMIVSGLFFIALAVLEIMFNIKY